MGTNGCKRALAGTALCILSAVCFVPFQRWIYLEVFDDLRALN